MSNILRIGLVADGPTDLRFLGPVVQRTYEKIVLECPGEIDVFPVELLDPPAKNFISRMVEAAKQAGKVGLDVLVMHTDAEAPTDQVAREAKTGPAIQAINAQPGELCRNLVTAITVRMVEAWLLADTALIREEIGTELSAQDLGIAGFPERFTDPKAVMREAIRRSFANRSSRQRRQLLLGELYQPLGQQVPLPALERLGAYQAFQIEAQASLRRRGYLP